MCACWIIISSYRWDILTTEWFNIQTSEQIRSPSSPVLSQWPCSISPWSTGSTLIIKVRQKVLLLPAFAFQHRSWEDPSRDGHDWFCRHAHSSGSAFAFCASPSFSTNHQSFPKQTLWEFLNCFVEGIWKEGTSNKEKGDFKTHPTAFLQVSHGLSSLLQSF